MRKAGGISKLVDGTRHDGSADGKIRMNSHEPISFYQDDLVAGWRVRDVSTISVYDWDLDWRYWSTASIDVLFADGEWRGFEWTTSERTGFVVGCAFKPVTLFKWRSAARYNTVALQDDLKTLSSTEVSFGLGNQWTYTAAVQPDSTFKTLTIQVNNLSSPAAIDAFATYNQTVSQEVLETHERVALQAVFNEPVSVEMVREIVKDHKLKSLVAYVATINRNGETTVWPIEVGNKMERIDTYLDESLADKKWLGDEWEVLELLGVVSVSAEIPSTHYTNLSQNRNILLLDLTPTLARDHFHKTTGQTFSSGDLIGYVPIAHNLYTDQPIRE